jgi:hypothetical protein
MNVILSGLGRSALLMAEDGLCCFGGPWLGRTAQRSSAHKGGSNDRLLTQKTGSGEGHNISEYDGLSTAT